MSKSLLMFVFGFVAATQVSRGAALSQDSASRDKQQLNDDLLHFIKMVANKNELSEAILLRSESTWLPVTVTKDSLAEVPGGAAKTRARGEWRFDHRKFAFREIATRTDLPFNHVHAIWDLHEYRVLEETPDDPPGILAKLAWAPSVLVISSSPDFVTTSCCPFTKSIWFGSARWNETLQRAQKRRVISRERFLGRDCIVVLFDNAPPTADDSEYTHPHVVWLDDRETLLALRVDTYMPPKGESKINPLQEINDIHKHIEERRWSLYSRFVVTKVEQTRSQFWFPAETFLVGLFHQSGRQTPPTGTRTRSHEVVEGRAELEAALTTLTVPEGTVIKNEITGEITTLTSSGLVPENAVSFSAVQRAIAAEDGVTLSNLPPQDPTKLSCGIRALLFVAPLLGRAIAVDDIKRKLTDSEFVAAELPMSKIADLAIGSGLRVRGVNATVETIPSFTPYFIALVREADTRNEGDHFVVASYKNGSIRVVSPPLQPEMLTMDAFRQRWTGHALLIAEHDAEFSKIDEYHNKSYVKRLLLFAGIILACVASILWLIARRRKMMRPKNREMISKMALGFVAAGVCMHAVGCMPANQETAIGAPRLATTSGNMPYDAGIVDVGTPISHEFHVNNLSDQSITITSIKTSCGCASVVIDNTNRRIGPGATVAIPFATDTFRDPGYFAVSADLTGTVGDRSDPVHLITLQVVAQLERSMGVECVNDMIDLGGFDPGNPPQFTVNANTWCRKGETPPAIDIQTVNSKMPEGWKCELGAETDPEGIDEKGRSLKRWSLWVTVPKLFTQGDFVVQIPVVARAAGLVFAARTTVKGRVEYPITFRGSSVSLGTFKSGGLHSILLPIKVRGSGAPELASSVDWIRASISHDGTDLNASTSSVSATPPSGITRIDERIYVKHNGSIVQSIPVIGTVSSLN